MARKRKLDAPQTDAELGARLRNLLRGATAHPTLEPHHAPYKKERAAYEALRNADDETRPLPERVKARESLLADMGRLDRALRECAALDRARERWAR